VAALLFQHDKIHKKRHQDNGYKSSPEPQGGNGFHLQLHSFFNHGTGQQAVCGLPGCFTLPSAAIWFPEYVKIITELNQI
jgi:hypothetical protein